MSTPPFLALPECARRLRVPGPGPGLAAVRSDPALAGWTGEPRGDLVLVPGFTGSKEDFIAVLEPLSRRGWRVLALDLRGQFESPAAESYALDDLAADLRGVVSSLPGPRHLIGHSLGGLVAARAALADPSALASLVLLCSGPGALTSPQHVTLLGFVRDQLPLIGAEAMYDLSLAQAATRPPPGEVADFLRRRYLANDPACLVAMADLLLAEPDRTGELAAAARSGLRVHVAYGEGDDVWPLAVQDALARACASDGLSHVLTGAGHSPAVDRPEETAALLDSLCSA